MEVVEECGEGSYVIGFLLGDVGGKGERWLKGIGGEYVGVGWVLKEGGCDWVGVNGDDGGWKREKLMMEGGGKLRDGLRDGLMMNMFEYGGEGRLRRERVEENG